MRKWIIGTMAAAMLLTLTACGAEEQTNADYVITRGAAVTETEAGDSLENTLAEKAGGPYVFVFEGTELAPGAAFDAAKLPEPESVTQVPSCAIEGTDNVYNYGSFELTAFDDGSGEVIYSIYLLDPSAMTPEGLTLGDETRKVTEAFGEDYELDGNAYLYTSGRTQLSIIVQNDTVVSIEYRLIVE